jgi:hypothetical protein
MTPREREIAELIDQRDEWIAHLCLSAATLADLCHSLIDETEAEGADRNAIIIARLPALVNCAGAIWPSAERAQTAERKRHNHEQLAAVWGPDGRRKV